MALVGLLGEPVLRLRRVRELLGQVLGELGVRGEDRGQRSRGRLVLVARTEVLDQTLAGVLAAHQQHPQRLHVHRGRRPLDQVVDGVNLLVGDRFVGEGVGGAGIPEQQVLALLGQNQVIAELLGQGHHVLL